jgi:apolipoprotein D and lipocalin family protein
MSGGVKMSKVWVRLAITAILLSCGAAGSFAGKVDDKVNTIKDIDINSMSGTWYEIARIPNSYEKGLVEVSTTFTKEKNGEIYLVNHGFKGSHRGKPFTAKARVNASTPGLFKVTFFSIFTTNYHLIEFDRVHKEYAVLMGNTRDYLWIFSRSPVMEDCTYLRLIESLRGRGMLADKLEKVQQDYNIAISGKSVGTSTGQYQ